VDGQRIGFAHNDWKVGGQLPALPNRLRRLCNSRYYNWPTLAQLNHRYQRKIPLTSVAVL